MTDEHTRPTRRNVRAGLDDLRDEAEPGDPDGPPEVTFEHVEVSLPTDAKVDADDPPDGDAKPEVRGKLGGFTATYDPATGDVDGDAWGHVAPNDDADDGGDE